MCASFEEPLHVDPVSPRQVAERHASRLLDDTDDSLIVFGYYEDCRVPLLPGVRKVLSWIEALGVCVQLECSGLRHLRFRDVGLACTEKFSDELPERQGLETFRPYGLFYRDYLALRRGV